MSTLIFEDTFDGPALDRQIWVPRIIEKHGSTSQAENIEIVNGRLRLKVAKEQGVYTCAGVKTAQKFRYGYYEIRAKLPSRPDGKSARGCDPGAGNPRR